MKSKIYISLSIPEKIKKRLLATTEKWQELPVKWVREANLHITLSHLGFLEKDLVLEICEKTKKAASGHAVFDLNFDKIELFPSENEPKMIALIGEPSEELKNLINDIEKNLGISSVEKKSFRPHITLGRLRKHKWQNLPEVPNVSEKFSFNMTVDEVEIMATNFENKVDEYALIESCPLS
jgi:RNA 2',3'-cyclic 3'-phosphodiesterase